MFNLKFFIHFDLWRKKKEKNRSQLMIHSWDDDVCFFFNEISNKVPINLPFSERTQNNITKKPHSKIPFCCAARHNTHSSTTKNPSTTHVFHGYSLISMLIFHLQQFDAVNKVFLFSFAAKSSKKNSNNQPANAIAIAITIATIWW